MTNKSIAKQLKFVADALELTGGNPFKVKTYANAAFKIERLEINLFAHFQSGEKLQATGIGKGISADVEALGLTAVHRLHQRLHFRAQHRAGYTEVLKGDVLA